MKDFTYYNNKLAVTATWLIDNIVSYDTYKYHTRKGNFKKLRRGGGADTPALIEYESIRPEKYKYLIQDIVGDPYKLIQRNDFLESIIPDARAREFFAGELRYDKNADRKLPTLVTNAEVLNACIRLYNRRRAMRRKLNGSTKDIWQTISGQVNSVRETLKHSLPKSKDRLRKVVKEYQKYGYSVLLHGNRKNKHAQKRNEKLEYLIISIYAMQNKPYAEWVHQTYEQFRSGQLPLVDKRTGELFDHTDPAYVEISPATVWNIVTMPKYEALIARLRDGQHTYSQQHRPHHHRHAPTYSLSRITLDDRDIMHTKSSDKVAVKCYYVFDDMSGAIIGRAYNKKKNDTLFIEAIKDMFLFLRRNKIGLPLQAEVENHLVRDFEHTLMTVFPFVRWTNPANSQEKYAERLIGTKKYGVEKKNNIAVGRHYSRRATNRITQQKIFDEDNNNYKERLAPFEVIVANDKAEIDQYNNELHPKQDLYPGKTRMQVFKEHLNPDLPELPEYLFARYIGIKVDTSIRRNSYVTANNEKFMITDFGILDQLAPNNKKVEVYFIPDENGEVNKVYLYQDSRFIGEAIPVSTYNRANAEWTDADQDNYTKQASYIAQFDKRIKDQKEKTARIAVIPNEPEISDDEPVIVDSLIPEPDPEPVYQDETDYGKMAVNDL